MKFFTKKNAIVWYSLMGTVGVLFGLFYACFGLEGLPVYKKFVPIHAYTSWNNGLYGAVFIGFSVLLYFVGRYAIQKNDTSLKKALLFGITSWLVIEAFFSLLYGVYINVGVDIILAVLLCLPLISPTQ